MNEEDIYRSVFSPLNIHSDSKADVDLSLNYPVMAVSS